MSVTNNDDDGDDHDADYDDDNDDDDDGDDDDKDDDNDDDEDVTSDPAYIIIVGECVHVSGTKHLPWQMTILLAPVMTVTSIQQYMHLQILYMHTILVYFI